MADLIVTSDVIDEGAKQLKSILDEFEHMDAMWDGGDIWGHETVEGAMAEFIDSWWVKRDNLKGNLSDLQEKLEGSAETWNNTETELDNSLKPE